MTLILSGTNGVSDVDGTAATPAVRGSDSNTGLFFPAADAVGASVGGVEGLRLTSTGLGIGTSSPGAKLDVQGTGNTTLRVQTNTSGNPILNLSAAGDDGANIYYGRGTGLLNIDISSVVGAVRLTSAGNLGLGVTPSAWNSGYKVMQFSTTGAIYGASGDVYLGNNVYSNSSDSNTYITTNAASMYRQVSGTHRWYNAASGTAGTSITFTNAMTLDASGRLMIGTTTAQAALTTYAYADAAYFESNSPAVCLRLNNASANNTILRMLRGSNFWDLQHNSSDNSFSFDYNDTERARITSGGDLLVGWTGGTYNDPGFNNVNGLSLRSSASNPASIIVSSQNSSGVFNYYSYKLGSATTGYHISFNHNSSGVGSITTSASATAYNTSSDYRLKENIQPMTGALAKVAALKPCTYKWKVDGSDGEGFIAHELAEVVPQCVTGEKDAVDADGKPVYQGIDTSFLVATLTAAIQELNAKLEAQAAEIAALKGTA